MAKRHCSWIRGRGCAGPCVLLGLLGAGLEVQPQDGGQEVLGMEKD